MAAAPVIIAAVAAIGSAATSFYTTKKQEDAQEKYNEHLRDNAIAKYSELDKQEADILEQSYKESLESQREYMQARSSVELQAAATGTYGQSIDLAIRDLSAGFGQRMADITTRREIQLDNVDTQARNIKRSVKTQADYTIQPPAYMQAMSTGLNTFASTYGTASTVQKAYRSSKLAS